MARNLDEIMADIRKMRQNLKVGQSAKEARKTNQISEESIREYVQKELKGEKVNANSAVAKHITDLLARNPKLRKGENGLAKDLPQTDAARKEKMRQLRIDAARSGMDKVFADLGGGKRRAAKKELKSIAQEKLRNEGKQPIADEKTALQEISVGRSRRKWRLMQPLMNRMALGSYSRRHDESVKFPETPDSLSEEIKVKTSNGKLDGRIYRPKAPVEGNEKVVLFFSGSGNSAGAYCEPAVKKYVKAGASVVTMDYRGFGKSETLNKKGKKTGTPLCEKTIYEDGKEMLKYVTETMGVKPENIILHGFSLGGAVASKVAADFYQEQQKRALEEGRLMKDQKLGGLVLQSSIDSMYNTAKGKVLGSHLAGMLGWSGAGGYNTKSHLQRLHKLDPELPVHFVSGRKVVGDHFDIDATNLDLDNDRKPLFQNSSSYRELQGEHKNDTLANDQDLERLAKSGRDVELAGPKLLKRNSDLEGGIIGGLVE